MRAVDRSGGVISLIEAIRRVRGGQGARSASARAPAAAVALVLVLLTVLSVNDLATEVLGSAADKAVGLLKDLVLAALLVLAAVAWRRGIRPSRTVLALTVTIWLCCAVAATQGLNAVAAAYGFRASYWGLALLVVLPMVLRGSDAWRVVTAAVVLGQAAAAFSIVTWCLGLRWLTEVVDVLPTGYFPSSFFVAGSIRPRAFSPYVSPNTLGLVMAVLCVTMVVAWSRLRWRWVRPAHLLALPVAALLLSQSRSALLDVLFGVGVVLVARVFRRDLGVSRAATFASLTLGFVSAAMLGFIVVHGPVVLKQPGDTSSSTAHHQPSGGDPFNEPSARGHEQSLAGTSSTLLHEPIGVGLGNVGPRAVPHAPDALQVEGSFLLVGLEIGLIGGVLYIVLLGSVAALGWFSRGPPLALLAPTTVAAVIPSQLLLPSIQEITATWLCWVLIGAALATREPKTQATG